MKVWRREKPPDPAGSLSSPPSQLYSGNGFVKGRLKQLMIEVNRGAFQYHSKFGKQ
jgi:hypothetical protein